MNGIINVLKPTGMTSHDVVSVIRKKFNIKKVGHTGTLDPNCAGVLPILVGKATKLSEIFLNNNKEYRCTIHFGKSTDTYDSFGKIISIDENLKNFELEEIKKVLQGFLGKIHQKPPIYSAIKINGEKLYNIARKGEIIDEIPERTIIIECINIVDYNFPSLTIDVKCSKGTYIRSLVNDIATKLKTYAYMSMLIRTSSGQFRIKNSKSIDLIDKSDLIEIKDLDFGFRKIYLDNFQINAFKDGKKVLSENLIELDNKLLREYFCVCDYNENIVSIAYIDKEIKLLKNKILF